MTGDSENNGHDIDRRTALKTVGMVGTGFIGGSALTGEAAAKGREKSNQGRGEGNRGPPCFKDFECEEGETYAKIKFITENGDCYFEEETDTGLIEITSWESKDGEECEPIHVEWTAEGYEATIVTAFGGNACDTEEDPGGSYSVDGELTNNSGQTAAISNLQFCLQPIPECGIYGLERGPGQQDLVELSTPGTNPPGVDIEGTVLKNLVPNDGADNYPNGMTYDGEVWYFSGRDSGYNGGWDAVDASPGTFESGPGSLYTYSPKMGPIVEYGQLADGARVAGAAFYNGEYYFVDETDRNMLDKVSVAVGDPNSMMDRVAVADLNEVASSGTTLGATTLGDVAISTDGVAYIVFRALEAQTNYAVKVDLESSSPAVSVINEETVSLATQATKAFAGRRQLAFGLDANGDEALYVHEENDFDPPRWWIVDASSDPSPKTSEPDFTTEGLSYSDLGDCAPSER